MTEGISVIVLGGNESADIERTVNRCFDALTDFSTEIIVVADESLASHDGCNTRRSSVEDHTNSSKTLQSTVTSDTSHEQVIWQNTNENRVQDVINGFRRARHSYWIVIDANRQHPLGKLPVLARTLTDGADIAITSRHRNDCEHRLHTLYFKERVAFTLMKLGIDYSIDSSDLNIMPNFFAVHRDVIETTDLDSWGYTILLDLLVKNDTDRIDEIPVKMDEYNEKSLSWAECQTVVEQIAALFFLRLGLDRVIAPIRAVRATEYALIGGIGTIINMLIFGGVHLMMGIHYLLAGMIAFIVALNWNFLGNWSLTFDRPHDELWNKYWKFIAVSLVGFVLYSLFLVISIDYLQLPVLLGNGIAIIGAASFNFVGSELFVFAMHSLDKTDTE
jgi:dolichol-phosphate mannosyltransferase